MPTPPYPLHPEPMKKSWVERNPLWKIPLGVLVIMLLIVAFGIIVFSIVTLSFHHSDVYQQAIVRAIQDPQVRDALGEPIKVGWFSSGELNVNGNTGNADLSIPISGPNGKGAIRAVAAKADGVWHFTALQVTVVGRQSVIDLLSVQPPPARDF